MAKTQNRLYHSDHKILGKELPLEQPYVLLVDPSSLCNLRCRFCPTGNHELIKQTGRYQGNMSLELFKKIIDDLKEFPEPVNVLRLYKEGEPLLNPSLPEMVQYARESGYVKIIDTTTNGVSLNPVLNRRLIEAGLDRINISVNGLSAGQIKDYTRVTVDFQRYLDNIKDLYDHRGDCEIYIKSIQELYTEDEQQRFYDVFRPMADIVFLEHISPAWMEFVFDDMPMRFSKGHYGQEIEERLVCPYIFYIMVVNADGSVSLCVGDWKHQLIYGDVNKDSVKDIWNNDVIRQHRLMHLQGRRKENKVCGVCQVVSHGTLEDIDSYREQIKKRMMDKEDLS